MYFKRSRSNKKGMELVPSTFVLILVVVAAAAAVTLILMGKWLQIVGFRYKMETQRNAMNLIQLIVTNSPIVEKKGDEPYKLVIDADKLDEYSTNFRVTDTSSPSNEHETWQECCDFLDYDYNLTVIRINTTDPDKSKEWEFGNLFFREDSECYPTVVKGFADIPVVISDNGEYKPGLAYVEMMRTPLSGLSFWLSQAFVRASWDKYYSIFTREDEYEVNIPLDPEIKEVFIDENKRRICACINKTCSDSNAIIVCKKFFMDNAITFKRCEISPQSTCFPAKVTVKKNPRCVGIIYPGSGGCEECP